MRPILSTAYDSRILTTCHRQILSRNSNYCWNTKKIMGYKIGRIGYRFVAEMQSFGGLDTKLSMCRDTEAVVSQLHCDTSRQDTKSRFVAEQQSFGGLDTKLSMCRDTEAIV